MMNFTKLRLTFATLAAVGLTAGVAQMAPAVQPPTLQFAEKVKIRPRVPTTLKIPKLAKTDCHRGFVGKKHPSRHAWYVCSNAFTLTCRNNNTTYKKLPVSTKIVSGYGGKVFRYTCQLINAWGPPKAGQRPCSPGFRASVPSPSPAKNVKTYTCTSFKPTCKKPTWNPAGGLMKSTEHGFSYECASKY